MQIVINIPEHAYEECKAVEFSEALEGVPFHVMKAIANGTPLPKGHGKLIDTSQEVEVQVYDDEHEEFTELMMTIEEFLNRYTNGAITIIEADKAESEK